MNEAFYVAISFIILAAISYRKLGSLLNDYLEKSINKLLEKIKEAESINREANNLFMGSQKKLEEFIQIKQNNLVQAEENALEIRAQHIEKTDKLLKIKKEDFGNYLSSLEDVCIGKARSKIASIVHSVIIEAIKHEKLSISNKLN